MIDQAKNLCGNPIDLSVITDAFESLIVDIAEGTVILEEATLDEGKIRTTFRLSVLAEHEVKDTAPIRKERWQPLNPKLYSVCAEGCS
tara:strand:+ start:409 stop:672 length:264 start_codon:yes stop_codon:yes gene_type:complete